jgi:hypothetical protein
MRITNNVELRAFLKGFYDQHVTALNGILEKLPEGMKADLTKLRDGLSAQLNSLPALDSADAAAAFNSFASFIQGMTEYSQGLVNRLTELQGTLTAKVTALNALEDKITKGEYLSKEKATEACELARTEAIKSVQPEIRATRKAALELAGLPVPGDTILDLPAKDYEPRVTAAKDQVAKLNTKGMKLGGKGDAWVKQLAWLGATEFAGQMTALEEVLGPVTPTKPAGDPLLGSPAPEARTTTPETPRITLV